MNDWWRLEATLCFRPFASLVVLAWRLLSEDGLALVRHLSTTSDWVILTERPISINLSPEALFSVDEVLHRLNATVRKSDVIGALRGQPLTLLFVSEAGYGPLVIRGAMHFVAVLVGGIGVQPVVHVVPVVGRTLRDPRIRRQRPQEKEGGQEL